MFLKKALWQFLLANIMLFSQQVVAGSLASYPAGWEDWPVVKESMNLPADTVLPPRYISLYPRIR